MSDPFTYSTSRKRGFSARKKLEIVDAFMNARSAEALAILDANGISHAEMTQWIGKYLAGGREALAVYPSRKRAA